MPPVLLDTDILSAVMRRQRQVLVRTQNYLAVHQRLTFSAITRYEMLRGLYVRSATTQLAAFDRLSQSSHILPLTDDVIERASAIYAHLYGGGQLIGDADILIAATALVGGDVIATNNVRHFSRILGVMIDNWLAP